MAKLNARIEMTPMGLQATFRIRLTLRARLALLALRVAVVASHLRMQRVTEWISTRVLLDWNRNSTRWYTLLTGAR